MCGTGGISDPAVIAKVRLGVAGAEPLSGALFPGLGGGWQD